MALKDHIRLRMKYYGTETVACRMARNVFFLLLGRVAVPRSLFSQTEKREQMNVQNQFCVRALETPLRFCRAAFSGFGISSLTFV